MDRFNRKWRRDMNQGGFGGGFGSGACGLFPCMKKQSHNFANTEDFQEIASVRPAKTFAEKHKISSVAAEKIEEAFNNVKQEGLPAFEKIGLDERALKTIMRRQLPSQDSIQNMSAVLGLSEKKSRRVLKNLIGHPLLGVVAVLKPVRRFVFEKKTVLLLEC